MYSLFLFLIVLFDNVTIIWITESAQHSADK